MKGNTLRRLAPRLAASLGLALGLSFAMPAGAQAPTTIMPLPEPKAGQTEDSVPAHRHVQVADGRQLMEICRTDLSSTPGDGDPQLRRGRCRDFLIGMFADLKAKGRPKPEERFCTEGTVTYARIADLLIARGQDDAALADGPPQKLVLESLRAKYPCPVDPRLEEEPAPAPERGQ